MLKNKARPKTGFITPNQVTFENYTLRIANIVNLLKKTK
jgi:hypothetical protein